MVALAIARQLLRGVLRRRKGLLVLSGFVAMVIFVPAAYYLSKEPPRYRTSASLILETRAGAQMPIFQELMPARPVTIQMALLKSRTLAESVIENLPKTSIQDLLENPYHVDYELAVKNRYRRFMGVEPEVESPQSRVLKELRQARVSFTSGADGLVHVSAEAAKPQVAVDIVNTYVDTLLSRTRSVNMEDARVSREFLETQVADVRKNLNASEEALQKFMSSHGGVKVPERAQAAVAQLAQVETALGEAESSRKMLQARLKAFRDRADKAQADAKSEAKDPRRAQAPATPGPAATLPPELARLRDMQTQLERGLVELRLKFTDEHPWVARTKERLADVQAQMAAAMKDAAPTAGAAGAAGAPAGAVPAAERGVIAEQMTSLEAALSTIAAQEDGLRKQAEGIRQSLKGLSQSESEYTRLVREVESTRGLTAMLSDKLNGARIREQGEMKVVKVIDPAGFAQPVTAEKRLKFLGGAMMMALVVGLGVPCWVEWSRKTIDGEDDVRRATGLPVLAILPRVKSLPLGGAVHTAARPRHPMARFARWTWRQTRALAILAWRLTRWLSRPVVAGARRAWPLFAWIVRPAAVIGRVAWAPVAAMGRLAWTVLRRPVLAMVRLLRPLGRPLRTALRRLRPFSRRRRRRARGLAGLPAGPHLRASLWQALRRRGVLAILPGGRALDADAQTQLADFGASFMFADALRRLQVSVQFTARSERLRTILVASAYPGEGKSTLVANLGHAFREAGVSAVMVDADFHRPTLHRVTTADADPGAGDGAGVVNALHDGSRVEQTLVPLGDDLWLVPRGGELTSRARAALAGGRMNEMMRDLSERADIVLCDSAPVLLVPENLFLAAAADGVILVAKAGITTCADLANAKATLDDVGARVLGVVINEMPLSEIKGQYKRYQQAYMRSQIA